MKKFFAFLNNMDAAAWRTIWVSLVLLLSVIALVVIANVTGLTDTFDEKIVDLRNSPWGLPVTILAFIVTSFIAAPQYMLFAAAVVAFGVWTGFAYALIGTLVSSWIHFYMGRFGGAKLVERYGGDTVNRLSGFIRRNDFLASLIVRSVPTAPAVVVNMAFGACQANFWRYTAGVLIGSIPKLLIVALLGQSVMTAMGGSIMLAVGGVVTVVAIGISVALAARKAVHDEPDLKKPADAASDLAPVPADETRA
ncbi:MAG TPA: VTT domain-containing protein [Hyphomonadaceae bacterium]|nr:VTT domain-containing protein [Hyphomonadaceae bacterium]